MSRRRRAAAAAAVSDDDVSVEDLRDARHAREGPRASNRRYMIESIENYEEYRSLTIEWGSFVNVLQRMAYDVRSLRSYVNFIRWIAQRVFIVGSSLYYYASPAEFSPRYSKLPPLTELREKPLQHLGEWGRVMCFNDPSNPRLMLVANAFIGSAVRWAYDSVIFRPNPLADLPLSAVNVFVGPRAVPERRDRRGQYEYFSSLPTRKDSDLWQFFGRIWGDLSDCDNRLFYFVVLYFAHIVQRPHLRTNRILCFKGPQGIGKTALLVNVLARGVFGNHVLVTENLNDVLGAFNDAVCRKTLIVLEETPQNQFNWDRFKSNITSDSISINQKFHSVRSESNSANFVILTNNSFTGNISGQERRMAMIIGSDRILRASPEERQRYIARMIEFTENPARCAQLCFDLYCFLDMVDLSDWVTWGTLRYDTVDFNQVIYNNLADHQQCAVHFALVGRHAPCLPGTPRQSISPPQLADQVHPRWPLQHGYVYDHELGSERLVYCWAYPTWGLQAQYSDVRRAVPPEKQAKLNDAKFRAQLMELGVTFTADGECCFPVFSVYCHNLEKQLGLNLLYMDMIARPEYHQELPSFTSDTFDLFRSFQMGDLVGGVKLRKPRPKRRKDTGELPEEEHQHEDKKPKVAVMSSSSDKPLQVVDLTADDDDDDEGPIVKKKPPQKAAEVVVLDE